MNLADLQVNWNDIQDQDFSPLPEGTYAAKITRSELKPTKDKTGQFLEVEFTLLGEKGVKGRKVFEMFNLKNKNPKAVEIGLSKMKTLMKALDLDPDTVQESSEMHGIPVGIKLKVQHDPEYGDKNRVVTFKPFEEEMLVQE